MLYQKTYFKEHLVWLDIFYLELSVYRSKYAMKAAHLKTVLTVLLPAILEKESWQHANCGGNLHKLYRQLQAI